MPLAAKETRPSRPRRGRLAKPIYGNEADREDPRWLLVERVAASRSLGHSPRLAEFLRYIVDCTVRDQHEQISEQQIGVRVFGRAEGYDSNNDNIVRNYARTLRKRLDDYFRNEGVDEPLTLMVPRGGYVPVFLPRDASELVQPADSQPADSELAADTAVLPMPSTSEPAGVSIDPQRPQPTATLPKMDVSIQGRRSLAASPVVLALLLAIGAAGTAGYFIGWRQRQTNQYRSGSLLWSQLFTPSRDTYIVPSDGGLVMMQSFSREQVTLPEYMSGSYRSHAEIDHGIQGLLKNPSTDGATLLTHKVETLAARRYTSIVDLDLAAWVAQLSAVVPGHLVIRFARDLTIDDLRNANAVLIGSSDSNPWVSLFEPQLNFQFARGNEFGGSATIVNTHPLPQEQKSYASITGDPENSTYGVIAYVPNLEGSGHVLLVEGVNMAATQAAANLLMDPGAMQGLLKRALDSHGNLQRFEVLLKTNSVASNASGVEVIGERVHPSTTH